MESGQAANRLSLDIFSLLNQKPLKEKRKTAGFEWDGEEEKYKELDNFFRWDSLTVKMISEDGETQYSKDLENFTRQNVGYGSWSTCEASSCRIELVQEDSKERRNSKIVHEFFLETENLAVLGPYLLFTHSKGDKTLKFIDLRQYENLIGREAIPVFELPINVDGGVQSLEAENEELIINGNLKLNQSHLEDLTPLYSVVFNLAAHMSDPGAMASATPLFKNVALLLEREFDSGRFTTTQVDGTASMISTQEAFIANAKEKLEHISEPPKTVEEIAQLSTQMVEKYEAYMKDSEAFKNAIKNSQAQVALSRKVWGRLRLALGSITKPLPNSSGKIKRALKLTIGNTLKQSHTLMSKFTKIMTGQRSFSELFSADEQERMGLYAIGAIALSQILPESYAHFSADGLYAAKGMMDYTLTVVGGTLDAYWTSTKQVASLFLVKPVYDQYIDPENSRWLKTLIGGGVLGASLAAILGGYHIPRRLLEMVQDLKSGKYKDLIERQNELEKRFAHLVSTGEAAQRKERLGNVERSDEQKAETRARLAQVKYERANEKGFVGRWLSKLRRQKSEVQEDVLAAQESLSRVSQLEEADIQPIKTKWQAIKHLLFSTASYRTTVGEYTGFFNFYASIRYSLFGFAFLPGLVKKTGTKIPYMIKPKPFGIAARIIYPEFFNVAVTKRFGRLTYPTVLNGGMTSLVGKTKELVSRLIKNPRQRELEPEQMELFAELQDQTPKQVQAEIEKQKYFEDAIIDLEEVVIKESLTKAVGQLTQFAKSDKDLRWLFSQTSGVGEITSQEIGLLNFRNKVFVRSYMDLLYNKVMKEVLERAIEPLSQSPRYQVNPGDLANAKDLRKVKKELIEASESNDELQGRLNMAKEDLNQIIESVAKDPELVKKAQSMAKWAAIGLPSPQVLKTQMKASIASEMDPKQNPSMKRYEIVHKMRQDEVAMARATRNEISTLFRTLPIDIGMKFLATAGITMGIMAPIQEDFWGPNSIAYLSQYSFYGSLLAGIAFSSVSSAWGKLQEDYFDAEDGMFGEIPPEEDAKLGYWKLFWKKWNKPENSLKKYWKNYIKIVFWNLPAAIPQIILLNYLFLGRFDLDAFVIGYISAFTLPFSALFFKLDQIFEQTAYYAARGLKEEDLVETEVQVWLQKEMQKLRNKFTIVRDLALNPVLEAIHNAEVTPTELMGPRALARYIFGGYTPTEIIVLKMRALSEASGSEVVKKVLSGCESFLTKGNPDLIKLKQ
tara:strand:- start:58267 stop:61989 length:3723 start_codon:yes stop_codon:yes gene_type:complete